MISMAKFAQLKMVGSNTLITQRLITTISKKSKFIIDDAIDLNAEIRDFKKHPGKNKLKSIRVPEFLEASINDVLSDENLTNLREESQAFIKRLTVRENVLAKNNRKAQEFSQKLFKNSNDGFELFTQTDMIKMEKRAKNVLNESSKDKIDYQHKESVLYLASRFATDYAALFQIFTEIKRKDPNFIPKRLFDFGSGTGTSMWSVNTVWDSETEPIETFNYDISAYMNSTAEAVIKKCKIKKPFFKNVNFKRNLPKSIEQEYDLVTSSFTLLDLPNRLNQYESVEIMWKMLKENGYLVLVETGNRPGFRVISEIRDFFIEKIFTSEQINNTSLGHIFSPCPHSLQCPMVDKNLVCKFEASHRPIPIYSDLKMRFDDNKLSYSYIVFKKSPKNFQSWPRFVLKNPKHIKESAYNAWICRDDVSRIDNILSSKSRDKFVNLLVRYSNIGDEFPVHINEWNKGDKSELIKDNVKENKEKVIETIENTQEKENLV